RSPLHRVCASDAFLRRLLLQGQHQADGAPLHPRGRGRDVGTSAAVNEDLRNFTRQHIAERLQADVDGGESIMKEVWERCATDDEQKVAEDEVRAIIRWLLPQRHDGGMSFVEAADAILATVSDAEKLEAAEV